MKSCDPKIDHQDRKLWLTVYERLNIIFISVCLIWLVKYSKSNHGEVYVYYEDVPLGHQPCVLGKRILIILIIFIHQEVT